MGEYTKEQLKIINSRSKRIEVESPPGSGKSYTILGIVKKHKKDKHLILAFNANIRESMRRKITESGIHNAEVHTFHSLAYDFFRGGDQIKNFENRKLENLDFFALENIMRELKLPKALVKPMIKEVQTFFQSSMTLDEFLKGKEEVMKFRFKEIMRYITYSEDCPMFHEFYIKMFQLMKYSTNMYDTVLVDESQDKTSCYNQIIENLGAKRIIHFGDNLQKIYAYNGAIGMTGSGFRLTQSFRIGKEHSDICNALIDSMLGYNNVPFEGVNPNGIVVDSFSRKDQVTVISRTNKNMMARMLIEIKKGKIVHIVGGKESLGLALIELIFTATPKKPNYYKKRKITSIKDAIALYMESNSRELKSALDFIDEYKNDTMKLVNTIRHKTIDDMKLADINLITSHKSKGLEFENVEIDSDFPTLETLKEKAMLNKDITGEVFALYVALSRSFGKLKLNKNIEEWYRGYNDGSFTERVVNYKELSEIF